MREPINPIGYIGPYSAIESLQDEFWQLLKEQEESLTNATYCGMTADVADQWEARTKKIALICQEIADLRRQQ